MSSTTEAILASCLVLITAGGVTTIETISKYKYTYEYAIKSAAGIGYILLNGATAVALFLIFSTNTRLPDVIGNISDNMFVNAFVTGIGWHVFIRIKIFTLKTPDGKEQPIGIETLWSLVVDIFESRIQANEERRVFDFIRPYQNQYDNIDEAKEQINSYFRTTTISSEEKTTMKRVFDNAETTGEIFSIFIRYQGTKSFGRIFPLSDNPIT